MKGIDCQVSNGGVDPGRTLDSPEADGNPMHQAMLDHISRTKLIDQRGVQFVEQPRILNNLGGGVGAKTMAQAVSPGDGFAACRSRTGALPAVLAIALDDG